MFGRIIGNDVLYSSNTSTRLPLFLQPQILWHSLIAGTIGETKSKRSKHTIVGVTVVASFFAKKKMWRRDDDVTSFRGPSHVLPVLTFEMIRRMASAPFGSSPSSKIQISSRFSLLLSSIKRPVLLSCFFIHCCSDKEGLWLSRYCHWLENPQ